MEVNQFTIKNREPDMSLDPAEFGDQAAYYMRSLNNPDAAELLTAPNGGILFSPEGATEQQRTQAAVGFAADLVGPDGKDVSNTSTWDYQFLQDALGPLMTDPADARRLEQARQDESPGSQERYEEIFKEIEQKTDERIKMVASLDGNADNLSVQELAFFTMHLDRNKDGVVANNESRDTAPRNLPSGGTVVSTTSLGSDEA